MGEHTKVPYVHHSFSPWWGCDHGCPYCFAATFAHRLGYSSNGTKGHALFGSRSRRRFFGDKYWDEPLRWNKRAAERGVRKRVLCGTMCDVLEDVPAAHPDCQPLAQAFAKLTRLMIDTPYLDWLLLTKLPQNADMFAWWDGLGPSPSNVWLGVTAENQAMVEKRAEQLLKIRAAKHFISYEPALGPLDATRIEVAHGRIIDALRGIEWAGGYRTGAGLKCSRIDWVIAGCKSRHGAHPDERDWFRALRDQCQEASVPFFLKQMMVKGQLTEVPELDGKVWDELPRVEARSRRNSDQGEQP